MRSRIEKFIEAEQVTAAEFADKIGVQRSSVSHVLNGRNNPSFQFIQKILEAYPQINSRWLLTGNGEIYATSPAKQQKNENYEHENDLFSTIESSPEPVYNQQKPQEQAIAESPINKQEQQLTSNELHSGHTTINDRTVVRVLIFYNDHTFEDFRPAK